ncbi:uncharacterized protein LOC141907183 [Tubulanus polymorphus]|uniref:uncharacterized protein LOC141907183 n=1 Tax=Tubulanus polymorphus TaxID=672921 RepID=UPI003DA4546C
MAAGIVNRDHTETIRLESKFDVNRVMQSTYKVCVIFIFAMLLVLDFSSGKKIRFGEKRSSLLFGRKRANEFSRRGSGLVFGKRNSNLLFGKRVDGGAMDDSIDVANQARMYCVHAMNTCSRFGFSQEPFGSQTENSDSGEIKD